jgi:hypothetical protein
MIKVQQVDKHGDFIYPEVKYPRMKPYTYASGRVKYICKNTDINASESRTDWVVWKYSDADIPVIEGPRTGAVNSEAVVNAYPWKT